MATTGHRVEHTAIAGYADQRNDELLVEAGFFSPEEAIRIMSSNGAKVLGIATGWGRSRPGGRPTWS
ncbi:MAG: hypothetical protein H0T68_03160 [Gemmatimonadales bacterium]|nr:hypothetical protein [Gemmatimonadales bacterium]